MSEIENLTFSQIKEYINSFIKENQRIYDDNSWRLLY